MIPDSEPGVAPGALFVTRTAPSVPVHHGNGQETGAVATNGCDVAAGMEAASRMAAVHMTCKGNTTVSGPGRPKCRGGVVDIDFRQQRRLRKCGWVCKA